MAQKNTPSSLRGIRFVVGTKNFDKISAVEGIKPSATLQTSVRDMDHRGLSGEERIRHLKEQFGRNRASR